eukprot:TRINITY_DN24739_c0_g3_i1.p1 TRINITY_DN24739_c0_g3~~TRINITY_DN24739_c0_g3_i1.p1  ORF type:complete len:449 (+),score=92.26 TRINITY_DN24739_c0_g3_i1:78-1349(+)
MPYSPRPPVLPEAPVFAGEGAQPWLGSRSPPGAPPIHSAAEERGWSGPGSGGLQSAVQQQQPVAATADDDGRAGLSSRPLFCGRRIVPRRPDGIGGGSGAPVGSGASISALGSPRTGRVADQAHLGLGSDWGELSVLYNRARGGTPPRDPDRRRLGLTKGHSLPNHDYADTAGWVRSSDTYGAGVPYTPPQLTAAAHDIGMHRREREDTRGTWNPPAGWSEETGGDWRPAWLPADPCVLFGTELPGGSGNPFGRHPGRPRGYHSEWPPSAADAEVQAAVAAGQERGAARRAEAAAAAAATAVAVVPPWDTDAALRVTSPDTMRRPGRQPTDDTVPLRPPCCSNSPAPARHAWRSKERIPPSAVVQLDRPVTLPRTEQQVSVPAPAPPRLTAIFGPYVPGGLISKPSPESADGGVGERLRSMEL